MGVGRHSTVTDAQREELWRRYKAGETVLGIACALNQQPSNLYRVLQAAGGIAPGRRSRSAAAIRSTINDRARPGDRLVLTKPIGSGVIATAIKQGAAPENVIAAAVEVMATLNAGAAEAMAAARVRSATDITGFGLLGHLGRMLRASRVAARIESARVPLLEGVRDLAAAGHVPGGTRRNLEDVSATVDFAESVDQTARLLLADTQTSGGMLISVPAEALDELLGALAGRAPAAAVIGEVRAGESGTIAVV